MAATPGRAQRRLAAPVSADTTQRQPSHPLARSCTSAITLLLRRIARTRPIHAVVGVVLHADIGADGAPTSWAELHRSPPGDPRGSAGDPFSTAEFLGDYVYAIATNTYGAAVWNDTRNAADCPAMDAWRMSLRGGDPTPIPAPQQDCPSTFGNVDIFGWTSAP